MTGGFPSQRPVRRSFDVFFDMSLNKRLSKQSWRRWFKMSLRSLWRHCNAVPGTQKIEAHTMTPHLALRTIVSNFYRKETQDVESAPKKGIVNHKVPIFIVRRAGLLWSQQDFEWRWSVPLFKCLTVLEFSFILFDLCLLITFFNFIMNYVPIVTFWIFTYHKI